MLSGCHPIQKPVNPPPPSNNASIKLTEAANSVSRSMIELARIQAQATPPNKQTHLQDPTQFGIREVATVDWSGPVEPLVKRLSKAVDYKMRVLGRRPAVPVIITLSTYNSPVASILRDIDLQAGEKAHVLVYPRTRIIELRYVSA